MTLQSTQGRVAVLVDFGVGAPVAAAVLEDFIAMGTRRFFSIGTAGSLQRDLPIGYTVLCDRAIRDEGVSHHDIPSTTYAAAQPGITTAFEAELAASPPNSRVTSSRTDPAIRDGRDRHDVERSGTPQLLLVGRAHE